MEDSLFVQEITPKDHQRLTLNHPSIHTKQNDHPASHLPPAPPHPAAKLRPNPQTHQLSHAGPSSTGCLLSRGPRPPSFLLILTLLGGAGSSICFLCLDQLHCTARTGWGTAFLRGRRRRNFCWLSRSRGFFIDVAAGCRALRKKMDVLC